MRTTKIAQRKCRTAKFATLSVRGAGLFWSCPPHHEMGASHECRCDGRCELISINRLEIHILARNQLRNAARWLSWRWHGTPRVSSVRVGTAGHVFGWLVVRGLIGGQKAL